MKKLLLITLLCFSLGAFAKGKIEIGIDLFPMGDFVAKAKLKGHAKKAGGGYTADKISLKIKKLKTGIELRDKHTHKYMKAKKHPVAVLTMGKAKGGKGVGTMKFMGKKKKIKFTYTVEDGHVVAKFNMSAKAWGIGEIDYKGVGVKDTIEVKAYVPIK
jgi:hypothetical protein